MKHKLIGTAAILLTTATTVLPARAQAPTAGVVNEGLSVPGVSLGASRAEVADSYGSPLFCQSVETTGDFAACSYPVSGGGQVDIRYRGAGGGNASNAGSDIVHGIRWFSGVDWVTTAGITAAIANDDPDALPAAYPNAEVSYHGITGEIFSVVDATLGIEITRWFNLYTGRLTVHMAVFTPRETAQDTESEPGPGEEPEPEPIQQLEVGSIDLTAVRLSRYYREITASVYVTDEQNHAASGANVFATWTLPDGSSRSAQVETSDDGYAAIELSGRLPRGTYMLTVNDIILADYEFEPDSATSSQVYAR
jgi:hypothetical protein